GRNDQDVEVQEPEGGAVHEWPAGAHGVNAGRQRNGSELSLVNRHWPLLVGVHPRMAAAMMIEIPSSTEPMTMATATFWSSSISLCSGIGANLPMPYSVSRRIRMPSAA